MGNANRIILILVALAMGIYRAFVEPTKLVPADIYKDLAHIFVGGLFGAWLMAVRMGNQFGPGGGGLLLMKDSGHFCFCVAVCLTIVEILAFMVGRF